MKTMNKLFICTILSGFALVLVGCGGESMPTKPDMTVGADEQALLNEIADAGGSVDRDEETDNITSITLSTTNATDEWLDKNLENLKKQPELELLTLRGTPVTKKRIAALKKELPKVAIETDSSEEK